MRLAAGILVAASACYSPTAPAGAPCDPNLDNCPAGQTCETTPGGSYCDAIALEVDGGAGDGTRPDTAPGCFGVGVVHDVCLMPPPAADVMVSTDRTINTAMVGNANCDQIIAQPGGGSSLCLIAARTITIASAAKLTATGANPLLLVATDAITVSGTIDVASRLGMSPGAGADTSCTAPAANNSDNPSGAGGGGAGGGLGTKGGDGGKGNGGTNGALALALAPQLPTTLRGGCSGGNGGQADGGGGQGTGGAGGGAVYLIAGTMLTITGVINASGSGGGPGVDGINASGGAGGGGSGGMIGLDAPMIMSTGMIFANGGGGGGGGGDSPDRPGQAGQTPTTALTAALGGTGGTGGGGKGGSGAVLGTAATNGNDGSADFCGGGGGGGGAGVIRVFGPAPSSLGGMVSPAPM